LQAQVAERVDDLTGVPPIPAMTSDAERECYYRLASDAAGKGEIIEFGAWLGASTAYMAAAIRDSGAVQKVHTFDKFLSKQGHIYKVQEHYEKRGIDLSQAPVGDAFEAFKAYLGPLFEYVEPHKGEIEQAKWSGEPIALIVNDAPKRIPAISAMLTNFRNGIQPGAVMAWQDFCHFPSYEIPASLYRLRDHFEFREAVYPGSTLVFRVKSVWKAQEVARACLDVGTWTPAEIDAAWDYWLDGRVDERKADIFRCGRAMFLCDIGEPRLAIFALKQALGRRDKAVLKKWRYLRERRAHDLVKRYAPLFEYLAEQGIA
jgi:hypothetical protein